MHRIKAILFDIDDTLYDLSIPFKEAFREFFPGEEMDLEGAFLASRKYSDRIYDRSLSGEISMEEMYIYRLGNAFRDYGKIIDGATALQFQSVYEKHQHNIHMTREMEGLLEKLSKKTTLGIITNGPSGAPAGQGTRAGPGAVDSHGTDLDIRGSGDWKAP